MMLITGHRSWTGRRAVSTSEFIIFTEPHDDSLTPEVLDIIPLVDIDGVRTLIGHGDDEDAQSRRPVSFPHPLADRTTKRSAVHAARSHADSAVEADRIDLLARSQDTGGGAGGGGGGWAEALPRIGGGTQFANTVEIRRRAPAARPPRATIGTRSLCRAAVAPPPPTAPTRRKSY